MSGGRILLRAQMTGGTPQTGSNLATTSLRSGIPWISNELWGGDSLNAGMRIRMAIWAANMILAVEGAA